MIQSVNPATGEVIAEYTPHSKDEVVGFIEAADAAHREWRKTTYAERAPFLHRAAELLEKRSGDLAHLMAREMGKPLSGGRAEAEKCAWVCRYYADNAASMLADRHIETDRTKSYVHYQPLGVVLAVMPWNFPLWQVFRFAAPALMAGNAGILKHASNVSGCAIAIEEILSDAGLPEGLFKTLLIPSSMVNDVIAHRLVRAATLTGSEAAGSAVAAQAGEMLKKTVLELGGSDPSLILADADLAAAAATCAKSRMTNNGQSCIASKRFVVVEDVYDEFIELFLEQMSNEVMGDPTDEATTLGPQARADLRDDLHDQVTRSIEAGADLLMGGEVPDGPGAFYPSTVLGNVQPGMPAYDEEMFGPVASIIRVADEAEAIRVANDTDYGLGASVYTQDLDRGEWIAATQLEAGSCFVNGLVASDPRLPFGGIKLSGYGRELADLGIKEFMNAKTVVVD
ncbi:MAG: NAD-dependent succinate-semialdehyde dehydrogenase [Acidimicrobiia bacterium]|nr:NAD-dependent succinate-semialdehyde dehydrogenase [Acidimicrobiia bacterium]